jgi:hypothetical protein
MNTDIWMADVARAFRVLGAHTREEQEKIAQLLGFSLARPARDPTTAARSTSGNNIEHNFETATNPVPDENPDLGGLAEPEPELAKQPAEPTVTSAPQGASDQRTVRIIGYDRVIPSELPAATLSLVSNGPPTGITAHIPLLPPRSSRSILQALLSKEVREGPVDIDALVTEVAFNAFHGRIPREPVRTLRFGVQVLVDQGDSMTPFAEDQDQITRQVRDLVGVNRTDVRYFADSPLWGTGYGPPWTWRRYQPPEPKTRILLLSNLGAGVSPTDLTGDVRAEWEHFAELVARHECDAVLLVPYPVGRLPGWITRLFAVATWDRSLTTGRASRAVP